jgi:cell division protein FtsI (penicillin-binding protein 3)
MTASIVRWAQLQWLVGDSRSPPVWHPDDGPSIGEVEQRCSHKVGPACWRRVDVRLHDSVWFGSKTGVELPGETGGILRKVERWQPSSIGSIAMGQEVGVTPVQMVAAFGTLANDGVRIAPHLVREIRNASGAVVYSAQPEQRRVVSAETATALRGMLEGVTLNGTAKKAQLDGYSAAGKTGTAQKIDPKTRTYSKTKYIGSFVGFAPVSNPQVVIIVVMDEPAGLYHGGDVAAPVLEKSLNRSCREWE